MAGKKKGVKKCYATGKVINENAKHVILVTKQGSRVLEETYFSIDGWRNHISNLVNRMYDELEQRAISNAKGVVQDLLNSLTTNNGKKRKVPSNKKRK